MVWTVPGPIGTLILGDVDNWRLDLNGDLRLLLLGAVGQADLFVDGGIGTLRASCWAGGQIRAKTLLSLVILGNRRNQVDGDFGAELTLTGGAARQTLGLASIRGDLANSRWEVNGEIGRLMVIGKADHSSVRSTGGMGAVMLGATESSDFLAGVKDGLGRCAGDHDDFEDPSARIGLIIILGLRPALGQEAPRYFFCDSNFSAGCFGTVILLNGDFETGQSGIHACDAEGDCEIRLATHRDTITGKRWFWPPRPNQVFDGPADFIHIL